MYRDTFASFPFFPPLSDLPFCVVEFWLRGPVWYLLHMRCNRGLKSARADCNNLLSEQFYFVCQKRRGPSMGCQRMSAWYNKQRRSQN